MERLCTLHTRVFTLSSRLLCTYIFRKRIGRHRGIITRVREYHNEMGSITHCSKIKRNKVVYVYNYRRKEWGLYQEVVGHYSQAGFNPPTKEDKQHVNYVPITIRRGPGDIGRPRCSYCHGRVINPFGGTTRRDLEANSYIIDSDDEPEDVSE